jgi:hypothetical protein
MNIRIFTIEDFWKACKDQKTATQAKQTGERTMESWRKVWRDGVEPLLSVEGLEALRRGLATNDGRLLQGATTAPPPLACVQDWPVEGACALGYCGWVGDGLETVAEVEEFFARMCFEIDSRLGEPAGCRWFLNWFDETPRDQMRELLLAEVDRALELRWQPEPTDDFRFDPADETAAA